MDANWYLVFHLKLVTLWPHTSQKLVGHKWISDVLMHGQMTFGYAKDLKGKKERGQ